MIEHTILMKWQHSVWIYNLQEQNTYDCTALLDPNCSKVS